MASTYPQYDTKCEGYMEPVQSEYSYVKPDDPQYQYIDKPRDPQSTYMEFTDQNKTRSKNKNRQCENNSEGYMESVQSEYIYVKPDDPQYQYIDKPRDPHSTYMEFTDQNKTRSKDKNRQCENKSEGYMESVQSEYIYLKPDDPQYEYIDKRHDPPSTYMEFTDQNKTRNKDKDPTVREPVQSSQRGQADSISRRPLINLSRGSVICLVIGLLIGGTIAGVTYVLTKRGGSIYICFT